VVGYKLGLTSRPMQELLGVDQPDFGPVLDTMVVPAGEPVDRAGSPAQDGSGARLHLGRDLAGPGVTRSQAADAVAGVSVAVEIIDSRIEDWKIGLTDTVADLASAGAVVVSPTVVPLTEVDPRSSAWSSAATASSWPPAPAPPPSVTRWRAVGVAGQTLAPTGRASRPAVRHDRLAPTAAFPFTAGDTITVETSSSAALTVVVA